MMATDESGNPIPETPKGARGVYVAVDGDLGPLITVYRLPMRFADQHDDPLLWEKSRMTALQAAIALFSDPDNGREWARAKVDLKEWADLWGISGSGFAAEASSLRTFIWAKAPWYQEGLDDEDGIEPPGAWRPQDFLDYE